ncbi:MAG: sulfatase-like hydrolase/transferase [Acidobacteria bacterium]|nr:sulfatase-like hydrolase/transferase [Acidobacteriota bacterium]
MRLASARFRPLLPIGVAMLAGCQSKQPAAERASAGIPRLRPLNVVLVTVDTLRPDHLRCYGYPDIETPALDGLARRGVLFENAVAQTPLTPPSHASIFTGQNPNTHTVRNTGGFVLPSSSHPLARVLQEQGWDTAAFVGSAVMKKLFGFNNGFALYDDEMPRPGNRNEYREDPERKASAVVGRAIDWLEKRPAGKPFFLWVHVYDPHIPYQPPAEFARKYKGRPYDGEIAYADRQIGRLFEAVEKKSPADKTVTAVLSDHGEGLGEHGEHTHGVFLYDSTLRIPFLIAGPGIPAGLRVKQQARTIDFLPTLLEVMGGRAPGSVQGISLVPSFSGATAAPEVSYAETLYPKMNMNWSELRALRTNRWKYIRAPRPELYDLASDPGETHNVISQNSSEARQFEAQLKNIVSPGGNGTEKVGTAMVDERVMDQLKSLGYVSSAGGRSYELTGTGMDPKDAVEILRLIDEAESGGTSLPESRRMELLRRALAKDPQNPSLYYQLGGRLEKNGRYDQAMQLYRTALSKGIESGRLHSRLADLLLRRGEKEPAIAEYEKAARINPADLDSQNNLAIAYLEKGRLADAERTFKLILANDAGYAAAQNGMGLVSIQKRDYQSARGSFERAAQLDPDLVEVHMNLGLLYEMAGDRARARASLETFLAKAAPAQYGSIIPRVREKLASLR